jgi:predicted XRE-type DNA-binding protein
MPNKRSTTPAVCQQCGTSFFPYQWCKTPPRFCSSRCHSDSRIIVDLDAYFWSLVEKSEGCWRWLGNIRADGYGRFATGEKTIAAHRYSLALKLGRPLARGEQANHACHNRRCVNPAHLYAGTQKENIRDAMQAGRMAIQNPGFRRLLNKRLARGTRHHNAKLTDNLVRKIRALRADGWSQQRIADEVGIAQPNVSMVLLGKTWKHVD